MNLHNYAEKCERKMLDGYENIYIKKSKEKRKIVAENSFYR